MILKINPTRIELIHLKVRLKTIENGYKLLKKKRDGLMKEFLKIIKEAKETREKINREIPSAFKYFIFARAFLRNKEIEEALSMSSTKIELSMERKNIMGVDVPVFNLKEEGDFLCYSLLSTTVNLDLGIFAISNALKDMVKLAELEKTAYLLALEIEKTRRRVNALEYMYIPNIKSTIKYISYKLDERERFSNIVLMKTKETLIS